MNIKLKYRAWVGEKHADISNQLTNSDIETFAIEFAEWLVKNRSIPAISGSFPSREWLMDVIDEVVDINQILSSANIADGIIERWEENDS